MPGSPVTGVGDRAGRGHDPDRVEPRPTPGRRQAGRHPESELPDERANPTDRPDRRGPRSRRRPPRPRCVPAGPGLAALIQEAEALHETLGTAKGRAQRLVVALRRQRKQARLMSGAIEALKQLRLQDVAAE